MFQRRRTVRPASALTRVLLRCGVVAGPLFVAAVTAEGAIRDGYRPARHPVSSLAYGPTGWRQRVTFAVTGGLYLAAAAGLERARRATEPRSGPVLLASVGAGLVGAAVFRCDPINGYPPGTSDARVPTATGVLHDLCSTPVFVCLPAAAAIYGTAFRRAGQRGWAWYSSGSAGAMAGAFVLSSAGFNQVPRLVGHAGAFQRVTLVTGFTWLEALAARALGDPGGRSQPPGPPKRGRPAPLPNRLTRRGR